MSGQAGLLLFGGAFDPPHRTHREILVAALGALPVQGGLVLPTGEHPHKGPAQTPIEARLELCDIAFGDVPGVAISDLDARRDGPAFTVDTVRAIRQTHPGHRLFWIVGADNLYCLRDWREHHALLELATLATVPRSDYPITRQVLLDQDLTEAEIESILTWVLPFEPDTVSATGVRAALAAGQTPPELDPQVADRIRSLGLYTG